MKASALSYQPSAKRITQKFVVGTKKPFQKLFNAFIADSLGLRADSRGLRPFFPLSSQKF
jgi:hypothetical protein